MPRLRRWWATGPSGGPVGVIRTLRHAGLLGPVHLFEIVVRNVAKQYCAVTGIAQPLGGQAPSPDDLVNRSLLSNGRCEFLSEFKLILAVQDDDPVQALRGRSSSSLVNVMSHIDDFPVILRPKPVLNLLSASKPESCRHPVPRLRVVVSTSRSRS